MTLGAEPVARRVLRIGFGLLWILDALLQLQSAMPLGLPLSVLQPSASTSPGWVQHVVHVGVKVWTDHPVQAAASAVWLQLGIGALLLLAPRGWWSRFAGLAAMGWGLVVWVFGEAFGGIFGSGASWLFGTPGAVLFYCVAGALVALPDRAWSSPRLGRLILRVTGVFLIGMAVLQAWPGRGFWQGSVRGTSAGTLTAMVREMAQTPQPGPFASAVRAFGRFDARHGWGVNLFVVIMLAAIGIAYCTADRRVLWPATWAALTLCAADWVFVQDLGFLGGVGTDPNSMVPMALVFVSGYLAVVEDAGAASGRCSTYDRPRSRRLRRRGRWRRGPGGTGWLPATWLESWRRWRRSPWCSSVPCPWRRRRSIRTPTPSWLWPSTAPRTSSTIRRPSSTSSTKRVGPFRWRASGAGRWR